MSIQDDSNRLTIKFSQVGIGADKSTPESTCICYFSEGIVAGPSQKAKEEIKF